MKLTFRFNLDRNAADRINGSLVCNSVSTALQRAAVAVNDAPRFQNNALTPLPFLSARSSVVVSLALPTDTITPQVMRVVSASVINAVLHSAGQLPLAQGAINGLAPLGSSAITVSVFGPVGEVKRTVEAGTGYGSLGSTNPLYGGTVVSSTDPAARVGDVVPSGLSQATTQASDYLSTYRTPLYVAGGVVALVATAMIVRKVL